jgi:exonuclease SbcC
MSSGRYTLHRATGVQDGRRKGGLDLDVLDAYTGRSRPVGTLSGGEGFEASLALALGLADTVQAQSGGIRLDAIFVDEGFGSLGSDDLDAVIGALEDLQEGGRLVGVISHVSELAERIPARLEISKKRTGSSARFVVP